MTIQKTLTQTLILNKCSNNNMTICLNKWSPSHLENPSSFAQLLGTSFLGFLLFDEWLNAPRPSVSDKTGLFDQYGHKSARVILWLCICKGVVFDIIESILKSYGKTEKYFTKSHRKYLRKSTIFFSFSSNVGLTTLTPAKHLMKKSQRN